MSARGLGFSVRLLLGLYNAGVCTAHKQTLAQHSSQGGLGSQLNHTISLLKFKKEDFSALQILPCCTCFCSH